MHTASIRTSVYRTATDFRLFHHLLIAIIVASSYGCAARATGKVERSANDLRRDAIERARVWTPTNVRSMNLRRGPSVRDAFAPNALVDCQYVEREMSGGTPKFTCRLPSGEEVKVKYGRDNGEVYAEVAATRLLWALGFGADYMYPVRVRCRGCPSDDEKTPAMPVRMFDAAAIERKTPGREVKDNDGEGWSWPELALVLPERGGASRAERDALVLLAVMLQHTDSKREQQRLICRGRSSGRNRCDRPFLLINDLGRTFGKANAFNRDKTGSVNLEAWANTPVWDGKTGCRGHLPKSVTGTLENPVISEEGRAFLARLLTQLTDRQLRDLFTVARFPMRTDAAAPGEEAEEIAAWVAAFKNKVTQIADRTCNAAAPTAAR